MNVGDHKIRIEKSWINGYYVNVKEQIDTPLLFDCIVYIESLSFLAPTYIYVISLRMNKMTSLQ